LRNCRNGNCFAVGNNTRNGAYGSDYRDSLRGELRPVRATSSNTNLNTLQRQQSLGRAVTTTPIQNQRVVLQPLSQQTVSVFGSSALPTSPLTNR
jgi:hypothetical protein